LYGQGGSANIVLYFFTLIFLWPHRAAGAGGAKGCEVQ
jgi:hypothetical protein